MTQIVDAPINLLEHYKNTEGILMKEFNRFISNRFLAPNNINYDLSVGDVIEFKNGYDVPMLSKILGFDVDGQAYVLWDCYWFTLDLSSRLIAKR